MEAFKDNVIMPYKLNMLHYTAFSNNADALYWAMMAGTPFHLDKFGFSPLEYAIQRKSQECARLLLTYIIQKQKVFSTLKESELRNIIEFSPANLDEFFRHAVNTFESGQTLYGILKYEPVTFR